MSSNYKFRATTLSVRQISNIIELERAGQDKINVYQLPDIPIEKTSSEKKEIRRRNSIRAKENRTDGVKARKNGGSRFGTFLSKRKDASTQTEAISNINKANDDDNMEPMVVDKNDIDKIGKGGDLLLDADAEKLPIAANYAVSGGYFSTIICHEIYDMPKKYCKLFSFLKSIYSPRRSWKMPIWT
jgi:hypothetical protein